MCLKEKTKFNQCCTNGGALFQRDTVCVKFIFIFETYDKNCTLSASERGERVIERMG